MSIFDEVRSAKDSLSERTPLWQDLRDCYYSRAKGGSYTPYEGSIETVYNLTQVMLDSLSSSVCSTLGAAETYCTSLRPHENAEEAARIIQYFAEKDGLEEALKDVSTVAGWSNKGIICCEWHSDKAKFKFSVYEPDEFLVYPPTVCSLDDAKMYGRKIVRRKAQVRALIKDGTYKPKGQVKLVTAPPEQKVRDESPYAQPTYQAAEADDEPVTLYSCITERDGKLMEIVVCDESQEIVSEKEYPYAVSRYSEYSFKPNSRKDGYYPASSVGLDLQQVQYDCNEIQTRILESLRANAHSQYFANANPESQQAIISAAPGSVTVVDAENIVPWNPKVDISALPMVMQMNVQHAERIARISGMAMGVASPQVSTATEASVVAGGQQTSIDEYVTTFARGLVEVWEFMQNVLAVHVNDWAGKHLKAIGVEDPGVLNEQYVWVPTVKSLGSTPQAQLQMAMSLWQLAQNQASGIDPYELTKRICELAERNGMVGASQVQIGRDLEQVIDYAAGALNIDPEALAIGVSVGAALAGAADEAGVDAVEGISMLQSDAGMGAPGNQAYAGESGDSLPGQDSELAGPSQGPPQVPGF